MSALPLIRNRPGSAHIQSGVLQADDQITANASIARIYLSCRSFGCTQPCHNISRALGIYCWRQGPSAVLRIHGDPTSDTHIHNDQRPKLHIVMIPTDIGKRCVQTFFLLRESLLPPPKIDLNLEPDAASGAGAVFRFFF